MRLVRKLVHRVLGCPRQGIALALNRREATVVCGRCGRTATETLDRARYREVRRFLRKVPERLPGRMR